MNSQETLKIPMEKLQTAFLPKPRLTLYENRTMLLLMAKLKIGKYKKCEFWSGTLSLDE